MDGLSGAASVIAVIDISAKITLLCFHYAIAVKDAKNDIERVKKKVGNITRLLEKLRQLLDGQEKAQLSTTHGLSASLKQCLQELNKLKTELEPRKARKAMSRFGMRALKWPFTSEQVEKIVLDLEGYEQAFTLALQIDQMGLMFGLDQKIDLVTQNTRTLHQRLDLASLPTAKGASFDSHAEEHNARCLPNTRTELLDEITEWAKNKDSKPMFWLSGMAGTGKSTIARTIAQSFARQNQLGASFFFKKREGERGNASRFFTTIATDLVACEPGILPGIKSALDADPAISERALKDQFEKLIMQPLLGIPQARPQALARVVVIDALDECEREDDIRTILQLLARTKDIRPVSLRVLVTSRPELHIRLGFRHMPNGTYQDLILHEVPKNTVEHDIRLFLKHELSAIQQARLLSSDWPTTDQIQALVELAVPLFIFAATICRYVGTKGGDPEEYLNKVLEYRKSTFSQLDQTYLPVLDQLLSEQEEGDKETWLHALRELVGSIVVLESPLSVASLANLLKIPPKQVKCRLDALHSVLNVPDNEDIPIRLLHLSFRDFLTDPQKQGKSVFWVDEKEIHKKLTSCCLELMSETGGLRQDMCNLSRPGALRSEIDEQTIASSLSPELQYACHYWVHHLEQSQEHIKDGDRTHLFLQKHFLNWLEVMSLIEATNECVYLLKRLQALTESSTSAISNFLRDATRFVLRFLFILTKAPLQVYSSALVFAPETSIIRRTFIDRVPQLIEMLSEKERVWDACRSTLEGHMDRSFNVVVFSHDGQLVASASTDGSVYLWETATGSCRSIFVGHDADVHAIAFSRDGLIATASEDQTVRLWEAATGSCRILDGHLEPVTDVAFSPNGKLVVSASHDETLRLWETGGGLCCHILEGHSHIISDAVFSPDGRLVASASYDKTIRLWETEKGLCRSILKGHTDRVVAVAFLHDRQLIASKSHDKTVRLWDVATGSCCRILKGYSYMNKTLSPDGQLFASESGNNTVQLWDTATGLVQSTLEAYSDQIIAMAFSLDKQLVALASSDNIVQLYETTTGSLRNALKGHSSRISDIAFSHDGQLIASASSDNTVRLWEPVTSSYCSTPNGHSDVISTVVFSPDGQLVASASYDHTVRLWEVATGSCRVLQGHSDGVKTVVFSPDGQLVASASDDYTVRLWEVATGLCCSVLQGHSDWINAVVFSPDGQLVASASDDHTVRLWEVATGSCRVLQGHSDGIDTVVFSPDGQLVASASDDYTVRLWEVATGSCRVLQEYSDRVKAVVFSPDGQLVASVGSERKMRRSSAMTWACRSVLERTNVFSLDDQLVQTYKGDIPLPLPSFGAPSLQSKQSRSISVNDQWILCNEEAHVWLPPEYRSFRNAVFKDIVCLGQRSGRVTFLKIR